jgi:cytochrome c553
MQRSMLLASAVAALCLAAAAVSGPKNELHEALQLQPDLERGRALYTTCAACHQPDGGGTPDGTVPRIAGQHYRVIIEQLADFRDDERIDPRMTAFSSRHHLEGPQQLADVAAYAESLPEPDKIQTGPDQFVRYGAQVYARACVHCHGRAGEGNDALRYPRLGRQQYSYLLKQLKMISQGNRPNVGWDHSGLVGSLTQEEMLGMADFLSRLR